MSRRQPKNSLSTTQSSRPSRKSNHDKPFIYQSSLEQFLKPTTSQNIKKSQPTTPRNKRQSQAVDIDTSSYPTKKRRASSKSPPRSDNCETRAGKDATTPIIVLDDSDDEVWDGDTLINSASTTRTLCAHIEKTTVGGSKSLGGLEPDHFDHTPATTPARSRSPISTTLTFSPLEKISVIPSSQTQERLPLLMMSLCDEEPNTFDSGPQPRVADEIIPSSQSQYLVPYVISPYRSRKFTAQPPPREVIPCSQAPAELDLVLLAQRGDSIASSKGPFHRLLSTTEQVKNPRDVEPDEPDEPELEPDRPPWLDQYDAEPEQQRKEQVSQVHLDTVLVTPPTTIQTDDSEHLERDISPMSASDDMEFPQCESSQSPPSSSLSCFGGNDSQYTFVEETCPSDIRSFLEELDKRTVVELSPPDIAPELECGGMSSQLGSGGEPLNDSEQDTQYSSLSLPASSSQFSMGPSSQYTFVDASLPSDLAEFLDRLEQPFDSQIEDDIA